ncbi:class I SAM-dependent methyltransferase [Microbispora sp. RL4-1S]|uniref:Class I SAM-dependent methyltransferase n=1 Tax=Microbispora oryzae TaxID=2806554 RepID=A0A940WHV2_9ACTN|nr:class I SAM-dependent methyltransferase [Microbispora oryzae]MBP2705860.1 class I SAM-dependent methyltransferase [Microbispora oryzae]
MPEEFDVLEPGELYRLDDENRERLLVSAPLTWEWSRTLCASKSTGGMEEWAKNKGEAAEAEPLTCDWYHGTWQFLRLLNMVAVPPWYEFYSKTLRAILLERPDANVLISAAADFGMFSTLHEAISASGASPTVTLYDICQTPLRATQWYAERYGLTIECLCDNLITSPAIPTGAYDLIVTDEFLTVLKDPDKPLILERWKQFLKPGGTLVTTAMIGGVTTPELREGYAARARRLLDQNPELCELTGTDRDELIRRFDVFAARHTRHMLKDEEQIRSLFSDFDATFALTVTPGECVNPTSSYQIVAKKRD